MGGWVCLSDMRTKTEFEGWHTCLNGQVPYSSLCDLIYLFCNGENVLQWRKFRILALVNQEYVRLHVGFYNRIIENGGRCNHADRMQH